MPWKKCLICDVVFTHTKKESWKTVCMSCFKHYVLREYSNGNRNMDDIIAITKAHIEMSNQIDKAKSESYDKDHHPNYYAFKF